MRRREGTGSVPARLWVFTAEEWPAADGWSEAFHHWCGARREWSVAHGWPGGEAVRCGAEVGVAGTAPDMPWPEVWR